MVYCSAWNCQNSDADHNMSLYKFPFDRPDVLRLWVHNMNRPNWKPTPGAVLCSDHFVQNCFHRTGSAVSLRWDAVPTIFAYPDDDTEVCLLNDS